MMPVEVTMSQDEWLSLSDVAECWVHPSTVRSWASQGRCRCTALSGTAAAKRDVEDISKISRLSC
jgi:hypothetical protein